MKKFSEQWIFNFVVEVDREHEEENFLISEEKIADFMNKIIDMAQLKGYIISGNFKMAKNT